MSSSSSLQPPISQASEIRDDLADHARTDLLVARHGRPVFAAGTRPNLVLGALTSHRHSNRSQRPKDIGALHGPRHELSLGYLDGLRLVNLDTVWNRPSSASGAHPLSPPRMPRTASPNAGSRATSLGIASGRRFLAVTGGAEARRSGASGHSALRPRLIISCRHALETRNPLGADAWR